MNTGIKASTPAEASADLADGWREVRSDSDIQFAEVPAPDTPAAPPEPPDWLRDVLAWLADTFAPVGEGLAGGWPVLRWVLLALAIALVALILWRILGPEFAARRARRKGTSEWQPDQKAALALLEEADRLAAEGRFDEATHLLLQRSVGQIAEARPDLIEPSSTAREIAAQPALSAAVRTAFAVIAERVERSLFALRQLSADDWHAARAAYADFALAQKALAA